LTQSTKVDLKNLVSEAVVAALDTWEAVQWRIFMEVNGEIHALSDQQVLGTRRKYSRVNKRYVNPAVTCYDETEN